MIQIKRAIVTRFEVEAKERAKWLMDGHDVELWQTRRNRHQAQSPSAAAVARNHTIGKPLELGAPGKPTHCASQELGLGSK